MRGLKDIKGITSWFPSKKYRASADEDKLVIDYFNEKTNGTLIDIAVADGVTGSNTFRLIDEYNWGGVLVEPNPFHFKNLESLFESVDEVDLCLKAIHNNSKEVKLQTHSGQRIGHTRVHSNGDITVPSIDITTLLNTYLPDTFNIDFVSLDIENSEEHVLNYWPWGKYKVELWCIERPAKFIPLLKKQGYERLVVNNNYTILDGNEFWVLKK